MDKQEHFYHQEYMMNPKSISDREQTLYNAYSAYEENTERYDRSVCTGVSKFDGCAMPVNGFQRGSITENAKKERCIQMNRYCITNKEWADAKRLYNSVPRNRR